MKRLISIVITLVLCMLTSLTAVAAQSDEVLPSGVPYSKIESVIDTYVKKNADTTAAVSVAVFTSDNVVMEKSYGFVDMENSIKNNKDSVFEWGSCTKLLVWTSIMQLVEKGDIDLNEDIRSYLPKGFLKKIKFDTKITVINLMNHNAGWQETLTNLFVENKKDVRELGDALQLNEPEQINEPGKVVAYSNWGTALAGYIVECISGQAFDDYAYEHIFRPLGMKQTDLSATISDNEWVARKRGEEKCYTNTNKPLGSSIYYIPLYPAGMAIGTINDFIKFGQAFMVREGEKSPLFKKRETLDKMLSPSLFFADGRNSRNHHGFWTDELGVSVLWHNGGTRGSSSWFAFDPDSRTAMIILTNQRNETIYNCGLLPLVFGKYERGASVSETKDISGMYVSSRTCFKGYGKLYSLISTIKFASKGDGIYSVPGNNIIITTISENSYEMDMGGLKQFVIYQSTNEKGERVLQLPASDYVEVNTYGVIVKYLLLVLFILSILYGFFQLVISFFRYFKHRKPLDLMEKYRTVVNASIVVIAVMFIRIAVKLFSGTALHEDILWNVILNAVFAVIPIIYAFILTTKWKKLNCTRKEKIRMIITGVAGLIMTINVILWEAYKFW